MVAARTWRHVRTLLESVLEHSEHVELRLISVSSPGSPRIEKILYYGNADRVSEGSYNLPFRAFPLEVGTSHPDPGLLYPRRRQSSRDHHTPRIRQNDLTREMPLLSPYAIRFPRHWPPHYRYYSEGYPGPNLGQHTKLSREVLG